MLFLIAQAAYTELILFVFIYTVPYLFHKKVSGQNQKYDYTTKAN
jgi:hypothetical protein